MAPGIVSSRALAGRFVAERDAMLGGAIEVGGLLGAGSAVDAA